MDELSLICYGIEYWLEVHELSPGDDGEPGKWGKPTARKRKVGRKLFFNLLSIEPAEVFTEILWTLRTAKKWE